MTFVSMISTVEQILDPVNSAAHNSVTSSTPKIPVGAVLLVNPTSWNLAGLDAGHCSVTTIGPSAATVSGSSINSAMVIRLMFNPFT